MDEAGGRSSAFLALERDTLQTLDIRSQIIHADSSPTFCAAYPLEIDAELAGKSADGRRGCHRSVGPLRNLLDYGDDGPIGRQTIDLTLSPQTFYEELSSARTFILKHEAQWLRDQGLGERVTCNDLLVFNETGPVGNELRFQDECVRHKALDLVGDLALAGCDIEGRVVAYRGGHRLNAQLVCALLSESAAAGRRRSA